MKRIPLYNYKEAGHIVINQLRGYGISKRVIYKKLADHMERSAFHFGETHTSRELEKAVIFLDEWYLQEKKRRTKDKEKEEPRRDKELARLSHSRA